MLSAGVLRTEQRRHAAVHVLVVNDNDHEDASLAHISQVRYLTACDYTYNCKGRPRYDHADWMIRKGNGREPENGGEDAQCEGEAQSTFLFGDMLLLVCLKLSQ